MEILNYIKPSRLKRQKRRDKRLSEELIECRRGNGGDKNKKMRQKGGNRKEVTDFNSETPRFRSSIKDNRDLTYFNDNLEPLVRFLQSNCGNHWDEVYSKLSKKLDKRSTQGIHVLDHLWDFVVLHVRLENNQLTFTNRRGYQFPSSRNKFRFRFYVHPVTKILTDNYNRKQTGPYPKKARWKMERDKRKWKSRMGIQPKKKTKFLFKEVATSKHRLIENQIYDVRIERLSEERKVGHFRVRLNKIIKSDKHLAVKIKILKSDDHLTGHSVILEKDNVRSENARAYQSISLYKWTIYEPGHFHFTPKRNRETFNYQY